MNTTPEQPQERWLPVVGYEGAYEVSDKGRVRSVDRMVLKGRPDRNGYPRVNLRGKTKTVHRLVLESFIGPCPDGQVACHANDIKTDNRLENLRWDTPDANARDMVINGKHHNARKTHCKRGNEFTPHSVYSRTAQNGRRQCVICVRAQSLEAARRRRDDRKHPHLTTPTPVAADSGASAADRKAMP
jgi:type II secretory pathway pseudopilin PulG